MKRLTFALVGISGGGPGPWSVEMKGPASFAVSASGVVSAFASDFAILAGHASGGVSVALASSANREIGNGVMMGESIDGPGDTAAGSGNESARGDNVRMKIGLAYEIKGIVGLHFFGGENLVDGGMRGFGSGWSNDGIEEISFVSGIGSFVAFPLAFGHFLEADFSGLGFSTVIAGSRSCSRVRWLLLLLMRQMRHVESVKNNADVGSGDPVLENGRVIEIGSGRSALEGAEGDTADRAEPVTAGVSVAVGASRLLFVGSRYRRAIRSPVNPATLRRVKLKRLPRFSVIHRFVYRDRVRLGGSWTKLQRNVSQLVFFPQGKCQRYVVRGRGKALGTYERLAPPARHVVWIIKIGQVRGGETSLRSTVVASVTLSDSRVTTW